jgi:solute carrier family 35 protein E1
VCAQEDGIMETLKTGSFFALWYLFNIGYNIYNKKALNALAIPYTMAALQLAVGIPYAVTLWATGLRKTPKLTTGEIKTLIPVSLGHLGTHIGAVVSLGAGAVSFTHIVKASEPVVSAALSAVMLGAIYHPVTYLTLLPIVGGVALASLKELSFTWLGFIAAMVSNVSSALRGILAKKTMGDGVGENMTEARAASRAPAP